VCHYIFAENVKFIDYEYTAYNYQAHDIAMHFCDYAGDMMIIVQ